MICLSHLVEEVEDEEDDDVKVDQEVTEQCLEKLYKEFISAVFNKSLWGYLKKIRLEDKKISLRNKLKLTINTDKPT